ncbi:MAG: Lin0512 family protein [Synergistetes bacterium]|nr:Lin0512 family protein [Synergistota bacterium]MCX8127737.1 Lin0512 family protein [Synergistota bacterium]MDW8191348.1 Lin0512 family protein [Synergistota bacterium]
MNNYKRFVIEFGMGLDLHGGDYTNASVKAIKDAISRVCLCGLIEILNVPLEDVLVEVILGIPEGGEVEEEEIKKAIPIGKVELRLEKGGLKVPGIYVPKFGETSEIVVVNACVIVKVPG